MWSTRLGMSVGLLTKGVQPNSIPADGSFIHNQAQTQKCKNF